MTRRADRRIARVEIASKSLITPSLLSYQASLIRAQLDAGSLSENVMKYFRAMSIFIVFYKIENEAGA